LTASLSSDRDGRAPARATIFILAALLLVATTFLAYAVPYTPGRLQEATATLFDRVPLWRFLAAHRPAVYEQPRALATLLLAACAAMFGACALAVRLLWNVPARRDLVAIVLGVGALGTALTLFAPPNLNSNLWSFMLRGRLAAAHGANPYVTPAAAFPDDPLYGYANPAYTGLPGDKLAAWVVVNIAFAYLGGGDPVRTLFVYRTGLFLFSLATLLLLAWAAQRLEPRRALAGMVLWAWNPIVLMNSLARTDTLMLLFLLAGIVLLLRGRRRLAIVVLTLSVYVKLITAPILAVVGLADVKARRWKELLITGLLVAVTTLAIWAPFYHRNGYRLLTDYVDDAATAPSPVHGIVKTAASLGFAVLILVVGLRRRRDDVRHLLADLVFVQLYFSLFFAKFASADYLLSLVALVALTMDWRAVVLTFAVGLSYFLFDEWYTVGDRAFRMPDLFPFPRLVVFSLPLLVASLALLVVVARRKLQTATTS
jgi:hypothetical protein